MFSVVIPLFNGRDTVRDAVKSVVAQTCPFIEIIIVDDGSTDGGSVGLEREFERLRVIRQPNCGEGPARNAGIAAASSDWIAFLDQDDIWLPNHLRELSRIRHRCPEAMLIGTKARVVATRANRQIDKTRQVIARINYFEQVAAVGTPIRPSSAAIHKTVNRELGGFEPKLGTDSEYWVRIALAYPVATSTRKTVLYVQSRDGMTAKAVDRWRNLATLRDLSPAVARLLDHYPTVQSERERAAFRGVFSTYLGWCADTSAKIRDFPTLRRLRRLAIEHGLTLSPRARLLVTVSALPRPAAWAILSLLEGAVRLIRGAMRARLPRYLDAPARAAGPTDTRSSP